MGRNGGERGEREGMERIGERKRGRMTDRERRKWLTCLLCEGDVKELASLCMYNALGLASAA